MATPEFVATIEMEHPTAGRAVVNATDQAEYESRGYEVLEGMNAAGVNFESYKMADLKEFAEQAGLADDLASGAIKKSAVNSKAELIAYLVSKDFVPAE